MIQHLLIAASLVTTQPQGSAPKSVSPDSVGAPVPAFEIDANIDLVSDYRFRGLSLSAGKRALQGGLELAHSSGAFTTLWASSLPRRWGSVEIDLGTGWSFDLQETTLTVGGVAYLYPDLQDADYAEATVGLSRNFGPLELAASAAYAPPQRNLDRSDLYLAADATLPIGQGLELTAHAGHERGPFNLTRDKWDWAAGIRYTRRGAKLSVSYVDTDEPSALDTDEIAAPNLVAAVSFSF